MLDKFFDWLVSLFDQPVVKKSTSTKNRYGTTTTNTTKVNPTNSTMLVMGHSGNVGAGNWSEVLGKKYNMKVINIAIGGKQSSDDLKALKQYFVVQPKSPDIVFIYSGLNDMWSGKTVAQVAKNQQSAIDLVRSKGAKRVYLVLGYDGMKVNRGVGTAGFARGTTQQMIEDYKQRFANYQKQVPAMIQNAIIIPVETTIERKKMPNSNAYSKEFVVDGLHLSGKAHKIFADHVDKNAFSVNGVRI
jgi:lysophospholipase L1-like esterase